MPPESMAPAPRAAGERRLRVFVAGLSHETNTFSPVPTSRSSFELFEFHRPPGGTPTDASRALNGYGGFVQAALSRGDTVYASTYATAQPSARCSRAGYESLRDDILGDLAAQGPFDAVFFFLHGAQMAEGYDDCEGDLLARARAIVGPEVFLGALLDLHANVSEQMVAAATALVACREYPHIDFRERAEHLYAIGVQAALGRTRPVMRLRRVPMLGMFYTSEPRVGAVNAAALDLQQSDGMLSVSLVHGFPYTDCADAGAGILTVADGDVPGLEGRVEALAAAFFATRDEALALRQEVGTVLDAIEQAGPDAQSRPFVVADACDNAGGGAGSDSTFILAEILRRGLRGYAVALLWDPVVAQFASDAGVGAHLALRLGGKTGPQAGHPLDVQARVLAIVENGRQAGIGYAWPTGLNVALEIDGNVVVVNTIRNQVFSPSCFTDLGIDPRAMRALVVKSTQHFRDQFAGLARAILYCETPGTLRNDFANVGYRKVRRPVWPLDDVGP